MRKLSWRTVAIAAALLIGALAFQVIAPRSHILMPPRSANGTQYVLYVHVPAQCAGGGCPAVYLLDGAMWLPTFAKIDDAYSRVHDMAPVVLVGIGYLNAVNTSDLRKRDFTPAFGRTPNRTGGADAFLDVLQHEIIPYAEAHLPIDGHERGLVGHSYGGLFAAYALARAPDLFDRYLILSPALWFDGRKIYAAEFRPALRARRVFLAVDMPRPPARSTMADDVSQFERLLLGQANIEVSRSLMLGTTHMSMVQPAARAGLPALYPGDAPNFPDATQN